MCNMYSYNYSFIQSNFIFYLYIDRRQGSFIHSFLCFYMCMLRCIINNDIEIRKY